MSEVKVNKLSPRSGTTVTIGDSGDTVNIVGTLQNNGSAIPGDISSVVAGTGLSGGGTSGDVTINIEAAQPTITSLGTITTFRSTGIDDNANALAMTIDSSENIGIGTTAPVTTLDVGGSLSGGQGVVGKKMLVSQTLNTAYSGGTSGSWGGLMLNNNNSSTSVRTATGLHFTHGTSGVAGIVSTSTTSQRADIRFITRGAGDAVADRVIIHDDGVMSASQGIALGVGTLDTASNVLNDYEEGTWSPTLTGTSSGSSGVTFGARFGSYTKIGRQVTVNVYIDLDSVVSMPTGNVIVATLPFTSSNEASTYRASVAISYVKNWDEAPSGGQIINNDTKIFFRKRNSTSALENMSDLVVTGDMNANSEIMLTATYDTA